MHLSDEDQEYLGEILIIILTGISVHYHWYSVLASLGVILLLKILYKIT